MTTVTGPTVDTLVAADDDMWTFAGILRAHNGGVVTAKPRLVKPIGGVLTVDLPPGPVAITVGDTKLTALVPEEDCTLEQLIAEAIAIPPNVSQSLLELAVAAFVQNNPGYPWTGLAGKPTVIAAGGNKAAARAAIDAAYIRDVYPQLARNPDTLIAGTVTRDPNGAATSAPVLWPDGTPGTYTALTVSGTFPGTVDSYKITYGSPVTVTYTQPAVTRDASGAATAVPAIVVS